MESLAFKVIIILPFWVIRSILYGKLLSMYQHDYVNNGEKTPGKKFKLDEGTIHEMCQALYVPHVKLTTTAFDVLKWIYWKK